MLALLAVLGLAFALAWVSTGWPGICRAQGWCDEVGPGGLGKVHK
jgi:hypothetical protein